MKRCSQCNMPEDDGTLYVLYDDASQTTYHLWCGGCLRNEVVRLRARGDE